MDVFYHNDGIEGDVDNDGFDIVVEQKEVVNSIGDKNLEVK